jgi:hypothetical protein
MEYWKYFIILASEKLNKNVKIKINFKKSKIIKER